MQYKHKNRQEISAVDKIGETQYFGSSVTIFETEKSPQRTPSLLCISFDLLLQMP